MTDNYNFQDNKCNDVFIENFRSRGFVFSPDSRLNRYNKLMAYYQTVRKHSDESESIGYSTRSGRNLKKFFHEKFYS